VLEQEELVFDLFALPHLDELLLKLHPVFVRDEMQAVNLAGPHADVPKLLRWREIPGAVLTQGSGVGGQAYGDRRCRRSAC